MEFCNHVAKNQENNTVGFPGLSSPECVNKQELSAKEGLDTLFYDLQIQNYINENGTPLLFYPYLYELDKRENITGEHTAAEFGRPIKIYAIIEVQDTPSWVAAAGFDNDDTMTAYIHIKTFKTTISNYILSAPNADFNEKDKEEYKKVYNVNYIEERDHIRSIEPKPGDLLQFTTFGCDREWDRGNKIFQITNKEDELLSANLNVGGGHYVWKVTAKRFRFAYQTGISSLDEKNIDEEGNSRNPLIGPEGELGNHQIYDSPSVVKMFLLDSDLTEEEIEKKLRKPLKQEHPKVYEQNIVEDSKDNFDLSKNVPTIYDNKIDNVTDIKDDPLSRIDANGYF